METSTFNFIVSLFLVCVRLNTLRFHLLDKRSSPVNITNNVVAKETAPLSLRHSFVDVVRARTCQFTCFYWILVVFWSKFALFIGIFSINLLYDVIRVVMATWLTHRMIALSKFYMMAKFHGHSLLQSKVMAENVIHIVNSGATKYS